MHQTLQRSFVTSFCLLLTLVGLFVGPVGCRSKAGSETAGDAAQEDPALAKFSIAPLPPLTSGDPAEPDQWWWSYPQLLEHVQNDDWEQTCQQIESNDSSRSARLLVAAIRLEGEAIFQSPDQLWFQIYRHTRSADDAKINTMLAEAQDGQPLVPLFLPKDQVGGNLVSRFHVPGRPEDIMSLDVSPDGKLLASLAYGKIGIYDFATGEQRLISLGDYAGASPGQIGFSPDGKHLISTGSFDPDVALIDVASGEIVQKLEQVLPGIDAQGFAFFPDGKKAFLGYVGFGSEPPDAMVIWDLETGEKRPLANAAVAGRNVSFSPNRKWYAGNFGSRDSLGHPIFDAATGEVAFLVNLGLVSLNHLCFLPDNERIAVSTGDRSDARLQILNFKSDKVEASLDVPELRAASLAVSPDGNYVAMGTRDGFAVVWDVQSNALLPFRATHKGSVAGIAFTPDGQQLITGGGGGDGTIAIWDYKAKPTQEPENWHPTSLLMRATSALAISRDGSVFATAGGNPAHVRIWNAATGEGRYQLKSPNGNNEITGLAFAPTSDELAMCAQQPDVVLIDLSQRTADEKFGSSPTDENVDASEQVTINVVAYSPEGTRLATGGKGELAIWDRATNEKIHSLTDIDEDKSIHFVQFSPDGSQVLGGSFSDNTVLIYDAADGTLVKKLDLEDRYGTPQFLPDGKSLFYASPQTLSADCEAHVVDIELGAITKSMTPQGGSNVSVALCDEGKTGVTNAGGWLEFWDLETETRLAAYKVSDESWMFVTSDEGKVLVGSGGYFQLYDWRRPQEAAAE